MLAVLVAKLEIFVDHAKGVDTRNFKRLGITLY